MSCALVILSIHTIRMYFNQPTTVAS